MFAYIYFSKKKNIYIISVISCHVLQKLSVRWKGQHLKRINSCLSTYLNLWLTLVSWHICSLIDSLATLTFGRSDYIVLWLPSYEFVTTTWLIVWEANHLHTPIPSTTFLLIHASLIVVNSFFLVTLFPFLRAVLLFFSFLYHGPSLRLPSCVHKNALKFWEGAGSFMTP